MSTDTNPNSCPHPQLLTTCVAVLLAGITPACADLGENDPDALLVEDQLDDDIGDEPDGELEDLGEPDVGSLQAPEASTAPVVSNRDLTFAFVADPQLHGDVADKGGKEQLLLDIQAEVPELDWIDGDQKQMEFLLVGGDLTNQLECDEWRDYKDLFKPGRNPDIDFSVYQVPGNHDHYSTNYCPSEVMYIGGTAWHQTKNQQRQYIRENQGRHPSIGRHGYLAKPSQAAVTDYNQDISFAFETQGVYFVGLDVADNSDQDVIAKSITFLTNRLNQVGPEEPVVIFQHFGFDAFSESWWSDAEREDYLEALDDHNVVAILSGHMHSGVDDDGALRQPSAHDPGASLGVWTNDPGRVEFNNGGAEQFFELRDYKGGAFFNHVGAWVFHVTDEYFEAKRLDAGQSTMSEIASFRMKIPTNGTADFVERFHNNASFSHWDQHAQTNEGAANWAIYNEDGNNHGNVLRATGNAHSTVAGHTGQDVATWGTWMVDPSTRFGAGELSVQIKVEDDDAFGLMYAITDEDNYYRVLINHQFSYARLVAVEGGQFSEIASNTWNGDVQGQWTDLKIVRSGSNHKIYLGGALLLDANDDTFPTTDSGAVAMVTAGMADMRYDRLMIRQ
ncbi:metallophosphoesterase family protein [Enhygromyxa salina]|uniref:3',5'-cyclic adenosine monophosphate phosphodiesterase CpdA n=1 Tax=Enhygromyxa salina TaxID=215803 RepID=A0A2S9YFT5_9BACT|nr:metallophosphoesterase [Enhygromyxa salina]PRQ03959.1 3',5'-cyclic adenosine monophosphate phosphodiesterase CpdA [Enhygromyxa salina]